MSVANSSHPASAVTPGRLLRVDAAAATLGVSAEEVLLAVREGRIVGYQIARGLPGFRIDPDLSGFHRPPPPPSPRPLGPDARRPKPPEKPPGWIYFIGPERDYPVKVGWTVRVEGRIGSLQTGCWERLVVLGALPAWPADERVVQARLAPHRCVGEWFERVPALALLEELSGDLR